jgi:integrase
VEAGSLLTSDKPTYDRELQPRNRNTAASREQVESIAKGPDANRLLDSVTTDTGSPIADQNGQVVSGNGRVLGLRKAYAGGRAETYRQAVIERAKALPKKVRGMTLFCGRSGRPVDYGSAKDAFARAREAAGVADVTIHDLRAKSLTDADAEGKDAQKLGGHTDARMTARYLRGKMPTVATAPTMPKKSG